MDIRSASAAAVLLLSCLTASAEKYEYGLKITTYPSPSKDLTGLLLEGGKGLDAKGDEFRMEFDLYNRNDNVFGTIFRIITDKGDNIDLMYNIDMDNIHYPILVTGEYVHDLRVGIPMDKWIPVSINLNPRNGEITLTYNGESITVKDAGTKGARSFRIAFGHCLIPGYTLDDVASVSLRDIIIYRGNKLKRHWDLSIHDGDICRDNVKGSPAKAVNPHWLVDQYISWCPVFEGNYGSEPSIAFDPAGVFWISCDGKTIDRYDVRERTKKTVIAKGGAFPANAPNQMVWKDGLIAYNLDENTSSVFNEGKLVWDGGAESTRDHDYWNNAVCLWEREGAVVSFGGYGHYHYNNALAILYPDDHNKDKKIKIGDISPRYGASIGIIEDTLYVLGGRGNLSGNQALSPRYYFDLHAINLRTMKAEKLWELENMDNYFIFSESMIYNQSEDCFYVFSSLEGGQLVKIRRDSPGFESVSMPAGFDGNSQYTNYNIYLDRSGRKLYATMTRSQVSGESSVSIKVMNYPPVAMQLLHQRKNTGNGEKENRAALWVILAIALTGFITLGTNGVVLYLRRRRKKSEAGLNISTDRKYYDFSRNSICFFGGFSVRDREGNDITPLFTPNLKALTILLILHSDKEGSGISSGKLNRTLWSYKPEEAANNNRNVYISKLRGILEKMDGFTITNRNKLWSIEMAPEGKCDWLEVKKLFEKAEDSENVSRIVELLLRGAMLPNSEFDWLDSYKGDFSNITIDILSKLFDAESISDDLKIRVANTIFMHDFLNEEALRAKCQILYKDGKTGLAKTTYDNFCKNYKSSLGMEYEVDFKNIIS
ncbi:MAG: hypothetical protein PUA47_04075 [Bacteroidales bacterium]|nr:hypothetical protein [Bacteroidales bacterium]